MEDPEARAALDAADAHPAKRLGRRFAIGGAVFVAITLGAAVLGQLAAIPAAGFALVYLWLARETLRMVGPAALLNRAYADVLVGAHESASRLLAALPKKLPKPAERLAASHEAAIALQRGDARRAALQATRAIDLPLGIVMRDWERVQVEYARSIRAMAHATLGEHAAASTDATCARESEHASVATLGKAELARAIVAAGQNRMSDLRDVLTSGAPFFDRLDAKERELVRSLERLVVMPASTVYRRPAKRNDDSPLGAWLAPRSSTVREEPAASAPLPKTSNRGLRTLALWALLVLMFLAIWQALNPPATRPPPPPDFGPSISWFVFELSSLGLIAYVALLVRALVAAARRRTALRQAEIALARGDDAAVARLGSNERRRGADVELLLAQRAERATDFATALACAEVGLRKSNRSPAAQAGTYDVTAPGLAGMRALALAALGRAEESDAALAAMPNGACYPFAPTARLRARLAQLLARGDRRGALELARNNAHVPLPTRDSLVVDLLEATDGEGADDPERARLRTALSDPVLAKWVEHFLPGTDPSAAKARVPPPAEAAVELPDHAEAVEQR